MINKAVYRSTHAPKLPAGADIILKNGRIYTVDEDAPWAEAVAIQDGKFLAIGSEVDVLATATERTKVIDLEGKFAMPGLYDMHTHPDLALAPKYAGYLDVGLDSPTPDEVKAAILKYAEENPQQEWVFGAYFVHFTFKKAGIEVSKEWLDSFIPDRPVAIMDRMWGCTLANSLALEKAGVGAATPDPNNGYIVRDDLTNEPTGILVDGAYALIIGAMGPTPHHALVRAYGEGQHYQSSKGVVGTKYVHVCEHRLNALKALDDAGKLSTRVEAAISWQDDIFPVERRWELLSGERHFYRTNRLNANAVKFHFDGTAEPLTSYFLESWPEDVAGKKGWKGKINLSPEHIIDMVADMDRRGIRVVAHCTGDGASDIFLDAVEACREKNGSGMRHQCAHSTLLDEGNLSRFKALDVIAEFSPVGWYPDTFTIGARSSYGMDRLNKAYNVKGVLDEGGIAVMGTDWPVSSINPWIGFETLVTRANPWALADESRMKGTLGTPISLEEAIRVLTINGAYSMGIEKEAGSIEIGKSADIIVLNHNLFDIEPQGNIHKTVVEMTFLEGQLMYADQETGMGPVWPSNAPEF